MDRVVLGFMYQWQFFLFHSLLGVEMTTKAFIHSAYLYVLGLFSIDNSF